jgi:CRISPR/Cas system-associated exonuclease Cas4 (RecB family)
MIEEALHNLLKPLKKPWPCHVNRISQLDDPCLRRLYYYRTAWDKQPERDDGLQGIFETGNKLEPVIANIISEAGQVAEPPFRIVGSQTATRDDLLESHKISGRIDGFWQTKEDGEWETQGVVDIKTSSPNVFAGLDGYESLSKYSWTRKYRGQLMLYALAHNLSRCILLFVNKSNLFQMKIIEFDLDFDYAENLLQKAKVINEAVDSKTPPSKINDPEDCPSCPFNSICMPDYTSKGNLKIEDNEELETVLTRLEELDPVLKEIKGLEKRREQMLTKGMDIAIGKFLVLWKEITATRKPSKGGQYSYWRKKIIHQD